MLVVAPVASGLVISDGLIENGHYTYDLTFDETANDTVLNADATSVNGLTCYVDTWNPTTLHEVLADYTNATSVGLIYTFDFSECIYRPTALALRENFSLFNNVHGHDLTLAVSGWRTEASDLTIITSFTTPQDTAYGGSIVTNYNVAIDGMPDVVTYEMSMTTQSGDGDGVLTADHNQWNRINATDANCFLVDFTVTPVPEPATLLLVSAGLVLLLRKRMRR
jgi:hypothetical protein